MGEAAPQWSVMCVVVRLSPLCHYHVMADSRVWVLMTCMADVKCVLLTSTAWAGWLVGR